MKYFLIIVGICVSSLGCDQETREQRSERYTSSIVYFKDDSDPNHPLCFAHFSVGYGSITTVPCESVELRILTRARK